MKKIKTYRFGQTMIKLIGIPIFRLFYRIKIEGKENIPRKGPLIIMSNHLSYFDAFIIGLALPTRTFFFLTDSKMSKLPIFGKLMPKLNCFFVFKKSKSHTPIEWNTALVNQGESTVFFPEGHRSRTGRLCPGKIGTGWMVMKTKAPIVHAILWNVEKIMPAGKFLQLGGGPRRIPVRIRFAKLSSYSKERSLPKNNESARIILDRIMDTLKIEQKKMFADMREEDRLKFKR